MPRPSLWLAIMIVMWAASAWGLSLNMTSPSPLPAGGTVVIAWAQDNLSPNPTQFSVYIVPEGPQENVIDEQLVNAGTQLSGTVTMVIPPETSLGVYDALAYTGTDTPTTSTSPALWGNEFNIVAAVQGSGSSSASGGSSASSLQLTNPQVVDCPAEPVKLPSLNTIACMSSSSNPPISSQQPTSTAAPHGTAAPVTVAAPKHALTVGAIVGIVLGLVFALAGLGLLLLYLRRRRQRRRYSVPMTIDPRPLSPPLPVITPFTPPMVQVDPSIRKDLPLGGSAKSKGGLSPNTDSPSGSSSRTVSDLEAQHQEAVARLEREVQMLRQQQNADANYGDEAPPEYNTL
ncbi:hypothetical protein DFH06DRAFT_1292675 [Mycena polygramma]|nr:hypothetical protein DFH06DRAFT_1292675 [Mycena polygramma]